MPVRVLREEAAVAGMAMNKSVCLLSQANQQWTNQSKTLAKKPSGVGAEEASQSRLGAPTQTVLAMRAAPCEVEGTPLIWEIRRYALRRASISQNIRFRQGLPMVPSLRRARRPVAAKARGPMAPQL